MTNQKIELNFDDNFASIAWLKIDGKISIGNEPYLAIFRKQGLKSYYTVNGIYGFGGMGYNGPISTQKLIKGLNKLGVKITAKELASKLVAR